MMRRARRLWLGLAILVAIIFASQAATLAAGDVIAVLWRGTPSEKTALQGFMDGLREAGTDQAAPNVKVVESQGNPETAKSLLTAAVAEKPAAIVTVGTEVSKMASEIVKDIPVVFVNVYDPVGSKLIIDWASSGNNFVGVSSELPVRQRAEYALTVLSMATNWAVVGSASPDATRQIEELQGLAQEFGLQLHVVQTNSSDEMIAKVKELAPTVDLIFSVEDDLVEQTMSQLLVAAGETPVYGATEQEVESGAIAGLALDYADGGRQAAGLLLEILQGIAPADLTSVTGLRPRLVISVKSAVSHGQRIPIEILSLADRVFE